MASGSRTRTYWQPIPGKKHRVRVLYRGKWVTAVGQPGFWHLEGIGTVGTWHREWATYQSLRDWLSLQNSKPRHGR